MLMSFHFDRKKIKMVKEDIKIFCTNHLTNEDKESLQNKYSQLPRVPLLLLIHYLYINDEEVSEVHVDRFLYEIVGLHIELQLEKTSSKHPARELIEENHRFRQWIHRLDEGINVIDDGWDEMTQLEMDDVIYSIGQLYNHFHVKEKLIFPVLERYGHSMFTREIWRADDRIRGLYQGAKHMIKHMNKREAKHVRLTYHSFKEAFQSMIFQEEKFLFPIVLELFKESEWKQIAIESSAYGYEIGENIGKQYSNFHLLNKAEREKELANKMNRLLQSDNFTEMHLVAGSDQKVIHSETKQMEDTTNLLNKNETWKTENIPFGGGFLTIEEANLILNHLPVEITFVDRNSIFKYFNQVTQAKEMMLIRTPLSIGRNVADCHPPKSLKKVMTLVRELKTKRRESESMWFKKGDAYVHITYKALFNERGEFIGILEYVQDISPFLTLPKEVKRELSRLDKDRNEGKEGL